LLQLISDHGNTISTGFFQNSSNTESLSKCMRYLKNVLNLDASVATLDANSTAFKLLSKMSEQKKQISFRGQIYIPVKKGNNSIWGFIKIENTRSKPTSAQVKKGIQAVDDLLSKNLNYSMQTEVSCENPLMIVESSVENGHRVSTNLFQDNKFTAFINISEWISQDQAFTLGSLREFSDSLLFVPEIMDLSSQQRAVIALYSLLPPELKKSSLIVSTRLSENDLAIALRNEANFLAAFSKNTISGDIASRDHILEI